MNTKFIFLTLYLSVIPTNLFAQSQAVLEKYQWKNRIVLVFSPSEKDKNYEMQQTTFLKDNLGIEEREIVIFSVFEGSAKNSDKQLLSKNDCLYLRDKFHIKKDEFCIVLIGKDGGEKYRKSTILPSAELFAVIDAMPMRRAEMNVKKN